MTRLLPAVLLATGLAGSGLAAQSNCVTAEMSETQGFVATYQDTGVETVLPISEPGAITREALFELTRENISTHSLLVHGTFFVRELMPGDGDPYVMQPLGGHIALPLPEPGLNVEVRAADGYGLDLNPVTLSITSDSAVGETEISGCIYSTFRIKMEYLDNGTVVSTEHLLYFLDLKWAALLGYQDPGDPEALNNVVRLAPAG